MVDSDKELLPEWQAARDVIAKIDDNLHDLRKYGFSFIAALLTIDALFAKGTNILPGSKPALIIGTMALVVVLSLVDRNYRVFQQGASVRATLLERRSSPELTQTISRTYEHNRNRLAFTLAYMGLAGVTWIIGALILQGVDFFNITAAVVVAVPLIAAIEFSLDLRDWVYFEIDGFTYKKSTPILVIVTNLSDKIIALKGEVWAVFSEEDPQMQHAIPPSPEVLKEEIKIRARSDYRWQFPTDKLKPGLYRVVNMGPVYKANPLGGHVPIGRYKVVDGSTGNSEDDLVWYHNRMWDNAPRFRVTD